MKRTLIVMLMLVLVPAVVSACVVPTAAPTSAPAGSATEAAPAGEKITVGLVQIDLSNPEQSRKGD